MWKLREEILSWMQIDGRLFGLYMWPIARISKILAEELSIVHEAGAGIRMHALWRSERRLLV